MAETLKGPEIPAGLQNTQVSLQAEQPARPARMDVSETARGLYVDPTPAYQPALDFVDKQRTQANERYAQNKADIANIFGSLTQVNLESQNRVNSQFTKSIADQQMATAERAAQARLGQQATQASAVRAMDERGGGPMGNLLANPALLAAERGIGDMNAYQQIWEGQQGAIKNQSVQDLLAANRGYGFQNVLANQQLQRSLEDTLLGLSGQETGIRGDLAGAIIGGKNRVAEANYNEIREKQAQDAAARIAAINAANQPRQYSPGASGIFERIAEQAGPDSAAAFSKSISDILAGSDTAAPGRPKAPTSLSEAMQRWVRANPESAAAYQGYATQLFSDIFSKTIPSQGNEPLTRDSLQQVLMGFGRG